ncbi:MULTISPECIES: hypothetical protein [unclassified Sphingobium]|uniref:hypothetical protein n=1 Tax=unclassified Sphingobium TaxID=2611147 RepID=UPI0022256EEF|nr:MULTISPECIES: hypothetical protein [unclassified Sphingobium]MCW2394166.1 hypothetical protein [Sphingobium sp. B8D3B]MCW2417680.1 hypothetical protein [Sphingobium sp. B8D3C]
MPAVPQSDAANDPEICGQAARGTPWWKLGCACLLGVAVPLVLGVAYLFICMPTWTGAAADLMAGGMVTPDDAEVAITPYTPTASAMEYAALSGRGEGLDCSIPPIIEQNAFPGTQVSLAYRQACVAHDYCYRHGAATYGYTQSDCDATLARATLRICRRSSTTPDERNALGARAASTRA